MLQEEGDKPQFKSKSDEQPYSDFLADLIGELTTKKVKGQDINLNHVFGFLTPSEDNSALKEWLHANDILPRTKFASQMAKEVKKQETIQALGAVPKTCSEYVKLYTEKHGITLSVNGILQRKNRTVEWVGTKVTAQDATTDKTLSHIFQLGNVDNESLLDLKRELRLVKDDLCLSFSDRAIGDAVDAWDINARQQAKMQMFMDIIYERGKATGPIGKQMWKDMEAACFDVSETQEGFAVAIIQKFMWQVKRKALGLPITNHLMPVITGPQGKGKSTFVEAMCAPLKGAMRNVDFSMITDIRNIDIWSSSILFLDEMGHAAKADMETVKKEITGEVSTKRFMHTNGSGQIKQQATLIGCSNKSLSQLIFDETGLRRFGELVWKLNPDFEAINALDWVMLWKSVDPEGQDPSDDVRPLLAVRQEEARQKNPIEMWAEDDGQKFVKWTSAKDLFSDYREWEESAFPRRNTNLALFGRTLTNLIQTNAELGWEKKRSPNGQQYRYGGL